MEFGQDYTVIERRTTSVLLSVAPITVHIGQITKDYFDVSL